MTYLVDFYNDGFGWMCRACECQTSDPVGDASTYSRVFREGEAESKTPLMANRALAKWTDITHQALTCPHCGVTEPLERL
ncbi:hypothetical protein BH10ACI2_BH10ACI2_17020 [soil metagenome]